MMGRATFALLLALPVAAQDSRPVSRAGLSWPDSESLVRKLAALEQRHKVKSRKTETVLVTEGELNSYLNLSYGPQMPPGISDVAVRVLDPQRIHITGLVDLDQVRNRMPPQGPFNPISLLTGRVPAELAGRFTSRDGFGSIQWDTVRLASIPLPISVLEQVVSSSTRTSANPQGFDIHAPFRLPYSVNRVRLEPGRAYLEL